MTKFKRFGKRNARSRCFIDGAVKISLLVICFVCLLAQEVIAQEKLAPNRSVSGKIEPGKTGLFTLALNDGDYLDISISCNGKIIFFLLNPDGTIARQIIETSGEAKDTFAFAAEGGGQYSFKLENPGEKSAAYELSIGEVVSLDERLKSTVRNEPYPSPGIERLRAQLAAGQTKSEVFWKQVKAEGTPLAEPFGSDGKYQLVTFLWRAVYDTRNVLIIGSFLGAGPLTDYSMRQIPDTDIWYLTLKLPAGARFTYQVSPNDPLTFDDPRSDQRVATRQADPLNNNPLSACTPDTSKFDCDSVAELPGAVPQPWLVTKTGVVEGRIEKLKIKSSIQKIERPVSVYTPANYKKDSPPNALLIMFDGEDLSDDTFRLTTLNNLIAASRITPTVAVFVENVPRRRLVDLVANPEFADFLAAELMPWIRARYNVSRDAAKVVVGGFSAGGLAAPYIALRHPKVFGNVLSISGAFWWSPEHNGGICGARCPDSGGRGGDSFLDATTEGNWTAKQFLASPKLKIRFFLSAGVFEINRDGTGRSILEPTRELRDVLLSKGYDVRYEQFVGGHDGLSWRGMLADGLIKLLGGR